jgi:hypothetical protein
MITANVIHRVFRVRYGRGEGTAFAIEIDHREYLVTAKHLVSGLVQQDRLGVFSNGRWSEVPISLVGHADGETDISVLASGGMLAPPGLPLEPTRDQLVYGQDVYFLGFPYGFVGSHLLGPSGYPLPFVKRATLSVFKTNVSLPTGLPRNGWPCSCAIKPLTSAPSIDPSAR